MATGIVKWFNDAKGFGFITPDEGGVDIFIHFSYIEMEGYKTLKQDMRVSFDQTEGPKGLHAQNIKSTEAATSLDSPAKTSPSKRESRVRTPQFNAGHLEMACNR